MPVLFALHIIIISWYGGLIAGEALAIGLPLLRLVLEANIPKPWIEEDTIINAAILIVTLSLISLESYITNHSQAEFSHGLCPECAEKHYGEFLKDKQK